MKKVKTFIHVFVNSLIPQVNYYSKILHTNFFFSLQYYLLLLFLLNIVFLVSLPFKYNPARITAGLDAVTASLKQFPADLKITINNNTLFTNYNRPYFMWLDYNNRKTLLFAVDESGGLQNTNIKPLFLLTNQNLIINADNNSSKVIPLTNLKVKTINKQVMNLITNSFISLRRLLPFFALCLFLILMVIIPAGSIIINTIYTFIASLISYGIFLFFFKQRINFKKTFQISLHAVTLPLIIDYLLIVFKPTVYIGNTSFPKFSASLPILFLVLISVFVFSGIYEAHLHHIKRN